MTQAPEFALNTHPLLRQACLIEASAGTGKTYNIAGLYLRLIVELALEPKEILVVTFTNEATGELKTRIHARLQQALKRAEQLENAAQTEAQDPQLDELFRLSGLTPTQLRQRLLMALLGFEEACIFTINGFCQKVLMDYSFESRQNFELEPISSNLPLLEPVVADFWRIINNQTLHPGCLAAVLKALDASPQQLAADCNRALGCNPEGLLSPHEQQLQQWLPGDSTLPHDNSAVYGHRVCSALQKLLQDSEQLHEHLPELVGYKCKLPHNKRAAFVFELELRKAAAAPGGCKQMLQLFKFALQYPESFAYPDEVVFADQPQLLEPHRRLLELARLLKLAKAALLADCLKYSSVRLESSKQTRGLLSFDDQINRLAALLQQQGNSELLERLRGSYKAALVDEFQDTNLAQYDIFKAIFIDSKAHYFYLIGDPKQSIYHFRGADINSYLLAASQAPARYTLSANYRSSAELIKSVHALFGCHELQASCCFLNRQILYPAVRAANASMQLLQHGQACKQPLELWSYEGLNKGQADDAIMRDVCDKIVELIDGTYAKVQGENRQVINARDIAILTRTNRQARDFAAELHKRGVNARLLEAASIWDSSQAGELLVFLQALCKLQSSLIKRALLGEFVNLSVQCVAQSDSAEYADWQGWLYQLQQCWLRHGFSAMLQQWLDEARPDGKISRLAMLEQKNGQRCLLNLLQLGDILHRQAAGFNLSPLELCNWLEQVLLTQKYQPELNQAIDEQIIALDNATPAVNVLTLHKSKGLEFPVVFCPHLWQQPGLENLQLDLSLDESQLQGRYANEPRLRLKPLEVLQDKIKLLSLHYSDEQQALADFAGYAEQLRLIYVALTRASYACFLCDAAATPKHADSLADGAVAAFSNSALGLLLSQYATQGLQAGLIGWKRKEFVQDYQMPRHQAAASSGSGKLQADVFSGSHIEQNWRMLSYSSLSSQLPHEYESTAERHHEPDVGQLAGLLLEPLAPDNEAQLPGLEGSDTQLLEQSCLLEHFPGGGLAGDIWHYGFEMLSKNRDGLGFGTYCHTPAARRQAWLNRQLGLQLEQLGSPEQIPWLLQQLDSGYSQVLQSSLDGGQLSLSSLDSSRLQAEMEFLLPLRRSVNARELLQCIYANSSNAQLAKMQAPQVLLQSYKGMLGGFIDLVFEHQGKYYILDYKSNNLGRSYQHYREQSLLNCMQHSYYTLQYHVYALALQRLLQQSVADYSHARHFGGIYYVFLRGVHPQLPGNGIFFDRPSAHTLQQLEALL